MVGYKKKINTWIIAGVIAILLAGGYYTYQKDQQARNNGFYTIAKVEGIRIARGGWRVWLQIVYENQDFHKDAIYFYEYFNSRSVGKRYFIKINYDNQQNDLKSIRLVPTIEVPDSIESAPVEGWSEDWMKVHFPKVVEYVHDTR